LSADNSKIKNGWIRFKHFIHINIQSIWTASIHSRNRDRGNYMLSRYEDLLSDPDIHMRKLCKFLQIDFNDEMTTPVIHSDSSFKEAYGSGRGLQKASIDSWRNRISQLSNIAILGICWHAMSCFGYDKK
jgi:hypothetical protein